MSWVPYTGAQALARIAARTMVARVVLGVALVALIFAAAAAARHPQLDKQPLLSPNAGGMIVLDLSASISSDTYSRIGESLTKLVANGGRYGLVVFSSTAYEALPPGTPASALKPLIRYFTLPTQVVAGEQATFPTNPWTNSFTGGTQISQGLDLARVIEIAEGARHPAVVLISDLADDPNDQQRLPGVLQAYQRAKIHLSIVALNAAPNDENYFKQLLGTATSITTAPLPSENPSAAAPPHASFPTWLVILGVAVASLLAANELRSARLRWGEAPGVPA
jgi:hypothetical protein